MKIIFLGLCVIGLLCSCSTVTPNPSYNPVEFATANYQKNVDNAVDVADLLNDLDKSKLPRATLNSSELATLVQADLYYNQGNYDRAYALYQQLLSKYQDPRIIYKAIICLEHISSNTVQENDLNSLVALFIKTDPKSKIAKLFQIRLALNQQQTKLANKDLDYLIKYKPEDARAILLFVSSIISNDITTDNYTSVKAFAAHVLSKYSYYPEAHLVAMLTYALCNDGNNLLQQANYVKQHYSTWDIPLYWSSDVLMHDEYYQTVVNLLDPVINVANADPVLQNIYTAALLSMNDTDSAEDYLNKQLTMSNNAHRGNILLNLGIVSAQDFNYSDALNYFIQAQRILQATYQTVNAKYSLPQSGLSSDDNTDNTAEDSDNASNVATASAANSFDARQALENTLQILTLSIGALHDYLGNTTEAIHTYQTVTNPSLRSVADIMLLEDYMSQHNYLAVNNLLDQLATKNKMTAKQRILFKASYYISTEKYPIALNILKSKLALYGNESDYLYQYAATEAMLKSTTKAISLYKKYIKLTPDVAYGYNDLSYIYSTQTSKYQLAKHYADIAYKLAPTDPNVLDTLGWAYYKLGDYPQAVSYIKTSYEVNYDPEVATHLKTVYLAMNRPDLAKQVIIVKRQRVIMQLKHQLVIKSISLLSFVQLGFVINPSISSAMVNNNESSLVQNQ